MIDDKFRFVTFYVLFTLLLVQTIFFCFAEHSEEDIYISQSGKVGRLERQTYLGLVKR